MAKKYLISEDDAAKIARAAAGELTERGRGLLAASLPRAMQRGGGAKMYLLGEGDLAKIFQAVFSEITDRGRQLLAAALARALGHGGAAAAHRASGLSVVRVARGKDILRELEDSAGPDPPAAPEQSGVRAAPGKAVRVRYPDIEGVIKALAEPELAKLPGAGDSRRALSVLSLHSRLKDEGYTIGYKTVKKLLTEMGLIPGRGGQSIRVRHPAIADDLRSLAGPPTSPEPLKTSRELAAELRKMGYQIGPPTVKKLLKEMGLSERCGDAAIRAVRRSRARYKKIRAERRRQNK
jgi:hypothetical protein